MYDLLVYGGTPGGVAAAVRAARQGLSVMLVDKGPHLGGMLTSGLCVWDTQYEGHRAPVYDELREAIFDYYRTTWGEDSPQYQACLPRPSGHTNGNFEPKVAREVVEALVAREPRITVLRSRVPAEATITGRRVDEVIFTERDSRHPEVCRATTWIDASYEGDLMACAGAAYRVGREDRGEYDEPHAGRIFVRHATTPQDSESARLGELHRTLRLRDFPGYSEVVVGPGSGSGDSRVQAYNWRTVLTDDQANRVPVTLPLGYDPADYRDLELPAPTNEYLPNGKRRVNRPQLLELQHAYPDGSWDDRRSVEDAHWDALLGALYYLQNDPSIDPQKQAEYRRFGLAADEFADNGHRPYEIYARETRRLLGRAVFTQHDAMLGAGSERAPAHSTSIAATEWYIDIHGCSNEKLPGSRHEGKVMLHQETFPGQVPYEALLPRELDNLLVTGCVSCTHVAWSTIRLEPTWMNIGESAGWAAVHAREEGVPAADIDRVALCRRLAESGVMIAFFNDLDVADRSEQTAAAQLLAGHGLFTSYDARLDEPLDPQTAQRWRAAARAADGAAGARDAAAGAESRGEAAVELAALLFSR